MRMTGERSIEELPNPSDKADQQPLDPEAVSRLFQEHNSKLVGYLKARLRSEAEAHEVAQEAYVRLLQLHRTGTPSLFCAWLFKTATNLAIDRLRRRVIRHRDDSLVKSAAAPIATPDPEYLACNSEESQHILQFLSELPRKCQEVFRLHCFDELTQQEVARELGLSDRMVRRYVTYTMMYCRLRTNGFSAGRASREITL